MRERPRWWPAALILAAAAAGIAAQWTLERSSRQQRVLWTGGIAIAAAFLLALWLFFFSGLPRRARRVAGGALLLLGIGALVSVEHRGYTGDMVPVFGWRFRGGPQERSAPPRATGPHLDFPQFFGPRRDGHIEGVALARDWEATPPIELWRRPVGAGWAGFAVAGEDAITLEQRGEDEAVVCYDLGSGSERWAHAWPARLEHPLGGVGPRTTPTIAGERVFALGATGILCALERASGEPLWRRDILADAGTAVSEYGASGSPLVLGDKVVVTPGGAGGRSMLAYSAEYGALLWAGGDDRAGYSSPVLVQLAGAPQILALDNGSLAAHDPASGELLWSVPWSAKQPNAAQPVVVPGDGVVVSSGYGVGAARYDVARDESGALVAEKVWDSLALKAKFAGFVHADGFLYGLDDGILACVDAASGRRRWKGGRYGHGQLLLVGELLLVLAEEGLVVLVEASPEEHRELASFRALDEKTWNPPAFAAPYLLVRNDVEAACFALPLAEPTFSGAELER